MDDHFVLHNNAGQWTVSINDAQRPMVHRLIRLINDGPQTNLPAPRTMTSTPLIVVKSIAEYRTLWTDSRYAKHCELIDLARQRIGSITGFEDVGGESMARFVVWKFTTAFDAYVERLNDIDQRIHRNLRDWFEILLTDVFLHGEKPSLGMTALSVIEAGWIPLQWRGTWPKGFLVAWCPPGSPQCQVPDDCIPTQEQLLQGGGWGSVKPPRRAKPPPLAASPEIAVVPPVTWKHLLSADDRRQALARHFAPLAETPECRDVLGRVLQRVERIEVVAGSLTLHLHRDAGMSGRGVADTIPWVCAKPYTGSLKSLPPSLAHIMRRHNGMALNAGASVLAEWLPYKQGKFVVEWDAWHTPDPSDPDDPFPTQPLVPVTDGSDLWLLHPTRRLADGEAPVVVFEHEMGTLGEPLPYPAGGAFLRLLLQVLSRD